MQNHPVMYAVAYKFDDESWVNFESHLDTDELNFSCLLPSKEMADDYIEDRLGEAYVVVPVTIAGYRDGVTMFEYSGPKEWGCGEE